MVLLIKFGKKEHLEQLKNGIVHFSSIELFQEDPTDFRGDKMEGKHYIDTSKPFLMNGTDISMYISEDQKSTAHLFVKDTSNAYPLQNEWRMIFLDHSNHYRLNGTSGINLRTDFSTQMPIFSTDQLGTLRCTEEYLYK